MSNLVQLVVWLAVLVLVCLPLYLVMRDVRKQRIYRPEQPVKVAFLTDYVSIWLANGDLITVSLDVFPWLKEATPKERANYEFDALSVYWPDLDDGIDIDWLLQVPEAA